MSEVWIIFKSEISPSTAVVICLNSSSTSPFGNSMHAIGVLPIVVSSCGEGSCNGKICF